MRQGSFSFPTLCRDSTAFCCIQAGERPTFVLGEETSEETIEGEFTITREHPSTRSMSLHDPELACGIMLDEWLDFVAWSDVLAMADCERTDKAMFRLSHPVWCLNGVEGWLYWTMGEISAKDPDKPLLNLMIETAHRLEARVRDNRGWFYLSVEQRYRDPPEGRHEGQHEKPVLWAPCKPHSKQRQQPGPLLPSKPEPPSGSVSVQVLVAGSLICLIAATAILIQS